MLILQIWFVACLFAFMPSWYGFKGMFFYPLAALFCLLEPKRLTATFQKKNFIITPLHLATIAYLMVGLISLIPSKRSFSDGLLEFSRLLIYFSMIVFFARLSIPQLLKLASLSSFSCALIGFLNWLNLNFIHYWEHLGALAPIGQVTLFADLMALNLPLALYLMYKEQKQQKEFSWKALLYFISFFWIWMGLWISGTRASLLGAIIALLLGLCASIYYRHSSFKKTLIFFSALVITLSFGAMIQKNNARGGSTLERLSQSAQITKLEGINEISSGRIQLYQKTLELIQEKPLLGLGLGNFVFHIPRYSYFFDHPHQEILYQTVELGLIGLSFYLVLVFVWFKKLLIGIKKSKGERQILLLLSGLGICIFFVSWQFSTNSLFVTSRLLSAWYLGLLLKLCPEQNMILPSLSLIKVSKILHKALISFAFIILTLQLSASLYLVKAELSEEITQKQNFIETSKQLFPYSYSHRLRFFYELVESKKLDEAFLYSTWLENTYPYDPEILLTRAFSEHFQGRKEKSLYYIDWVLKIVPNHPEAKKLQKLFEQKA